jgi:hypothetical protein
MYKYATFLLLWVSTAAFADTLAGFKSTQFKVQCGFDQAPITVTLSAKIGDVVAGNTYQLMTHFSGSFDEKAASLSCANVDYIIGEMSNDFRTYMFVYGPNGAFSIRIPEEPATVCQGVAI